MARAVAALGAAAFVAAAFGGGVTVFGSGALATHTSPSACLPCGHTNGQTRRWVPCTALIALDDTSSGMLMEVSLMNLCQAALVPSSNSPLTAPLKQPTRWSSTCNERVMGRPPVQFECLWIGRCHHRLALQRRYKGSNPLFRNGAFRTIRKLQDKLP